MSRDRKSIRLRNWDYSSEGFYFITICSQQRVNYFGRIEHNKVELSEIGRIALQYWKEIPDHFPFSRIDEYVIMPNHVHGILFLRNVGPCHGMAPENKDEIPVGTRQGVSGKNPMRTQQGVSGKNPMRTQHGVSGKNVSTEDNNDNSVATENGLPKEDKNLMAIQDGICKEDKDDPLAIEHQVTEMNIIDPFERTRHGVSLQINNYGDTGPCHGMPLRKHNQNEFSKPIKNSVSVIINQYKSSVTRWCYKNDYKIFRWQNRYYDHIIFNEELLDSYRKYIRENPLNWENDEAYNN